MAYRNYYRCVIYNEYLGISKEISAPTRYELDRKVENQQRIWAERINKELDRQNKEQMKLHAEKLSTIDNKAIEEYRSIIKKINKQTHIKYYLSLINNEEFEKFSTTLKMPLLEEAYKDVEVPKASFIEKISKNKKLNRINKEQEALEIFNKRKEFYETKLSEENKLYDEKKKKYIEKQAKDNSLVEERKQKFENGDIEEIEEYFTYVLNNSKYPNNFTIDFDLQYIDNIKTIVVSYYLPNEESIPNISQHKYVASRNEIDEIKMKTKEFEKLYNDTIYMCTLKTIKEVFSSDDLDYVDNVVFNGWIRYIDKSNGKPTESCVITVEVDKNKFNDINLDNIDYKECIKGLKGIFAPNILTMTPVVPYLNINREDSRFIENKDVNNIALDGFNLATMPWEDFEYFVRELFDKMFNVNGGEVKVTQASHDGGVDAIAFDDDPIRGGKFVIQAKRYNNVVPVSAVRDLYGTMIHEGATKGILVTTSFYGKEAYDFSKDKPITLIDGSALLGLLNKYGYSNLTIKIDKNNKRDNY